MELNAAVIIEACRAGAEEAARLAPFLDDLDGWDGADCDTGTNAAATMAALAAAMDSLEPRAHLRVALEAGVETIIRRGLGHSGLALGALFEAWAGALGVQLGGENRYGDRVESRPTLGDGPRPAGSQVRRAATLVTVVTAAATGLLAGALIVFGGGRK